VAAGTSAARTDPKANGARSCTGSHPRGWQIDGSWKYNPACVTEVEINFAPVDALQTRVDFEHRHLERLGENAAAVRDMLNSGWGGILELYGKLVAGTELNK
jgi:hypothetical protein